MKISQPAFTKLSFIKQGLAMTALALSLQAVAEPLEVTDTHRALIEKHLIDLEGGRNFRDLGGYQTMDGRTVKTGKIFRSGVMHHLTDADYQKLGSYDIKTIVDFRATEERESEPTEWAAGDLKMVTWDYTMSFGDNRTILEKFADPALDGRSAELLMADLYRSITEEQTPHYAVLFEELYSSDDALVFNCSAGKDRTGVAAALVLTALGVDQETVIQDYVLSEVINSLPEYQNKAPSLTTGNGDDRYAFLASMPPAALDALMGTRRLYIETAFDEMTRRYGSVQNYMHEELGLTQSRLAQLKANFLE